MEIGTRALRGLVAAAVVSMLAVGCGGGDIVDCGSPEPEHEGNATYYSWADGRGACGFDRAGGANLVAAMNEPDYNGAEACGACVHAVGPDGEVTVRITDLCPECPRGHLDLSPQAFERIAEPRLGRVPVRWRYVPCDVSGPIRYHFKDGSNPWWTAIQIRNHRNRVRSLSWVDGSGSTHRFRRESYNYFVEPSGLGPGPYSLQVEDVYGNTLGDPVVPLRENGDAAGNEQFPACGAAE
jgi:expansin (peptidoglycan-binding protein)